MKSEKEIEVPYATRVAGNRPIPISDNRPNNSSQNVPISEMNVT